MSFKTLVCEVIGTQISTLIERENSVDTFGPATLGVDNSDIVEVEYSGTTTDVIEEWVSILEDNATDYLQNKFPNAKIHVKFELTNEEILSNNIRVKAERQSDNQIFDVENKMTGDVLTVRGKRSFSIVDPDDDYTVFALAVNNLGADLSVVDWDSYNNTSKH